MTDEVFPHFVGCGRSGTTLFRNIFDAHPLLAMTHEAHFVGPMAKSRSRYEKADGFDTQAFLRDLNRDSNFRRQALDEIRLGEALAAAGPSSYADAVRVVFSRYAAERGKSLYGDKTPGSVSYVEVIAETFPEAKFVHVIRDGRAVALSYLERPEWGPRNMAEAASHWKTRVLRGAEAGRAVGPERYVEARYEDLVADPEAVTRRLCDFIGLEFEPEMLRYHEKGREFVSETKDPEAFKNLTKPVTADLRDWRQEISDADERLFEAIAGTELRRFGYPVSDDSPTIPTRLRAGIAALSWQRKRLMSVIPTPNKVADRAEPGQVK